MQAANVVRQAGQPAAVGRVRHQTNATSSSGFVCTPQRRRRAMLPPHCCQAADNGSATGDARQGAAATAAVGRRAALLGGGAAWVAAADMLLQPAPAQAGLERYVKKRQLDPLATYVPLVLEAREALGTLEAVMTRDPSAARQQLRSGPFAGIRDSIRALGQYAARPAAAGGSGAAAQLSEQEASALVQGFFQALEDFDLVLYSAVREYKAQADGASKQAGSGDGAEGGGMPAVDPAVGLDAAAARSKLAAAVQALDKLIDTVPAGVRAQAQAVLDKVQGRPAAAAAAAAAAAVAGAASS